MPETLTRRRLVGAPSSEPEPQPELEREWVREREPGLPPPEVRAL